MSNRNILVVLLANSGVVKTEWIEQSIRDILDNPEITASIPVKLEKDHHTFLAKRLREDGCLDTFLISAGKRFRPIGRTCPAATSLPQLLDAERALAAFQPRRPAPWSFMGDKIKPLIIEECFDIHNEDDLLRIEKWLLAEGIVSH